MLGVVLAACSGEQAGPAPPPPRTPAPVPSSSAAAVTWPGPANTGVPEGIQLRVVHGNVTARADLRGLEIHGDLLVAANGITIRDVLVVGGRINVGYDHRNVKIIDTEVDGRGLADPDSMVSAVGDSGYTCIRCDVHGWSSGFWVGTDVTIENSWVHDLCCDSPSHKDAVGSNGGSDVVLRHNNLECAPVGCSAAIGLFGDQEPIADFVVEANLLNTTGSYCSYGGSVDHKAHPVSSGVRWIGNHYGRKFNPRCGLYGPSAYFDVGAHGNVWSENVWADDESPVSP